MKTLPDGQKIIEPDDPCAVCGFSGKTHRVPNMMNMIRCFSCGWTVDCRNQDQRNYNPKHVDALQDVALYKECVKAGFPFIKFISQKI